VAGGWRRLHEKLHKLYASPNIVGVIKSRTIKWAGYFARMGHTKNAYKVLVLKSERKRPFGKPRRKW